MQYSGVVVTTRIGDLDAVAARLESLPGVEIYVRDDPGGRIVVVQEAEEVSMHEDLFRQIQATRGVVATELVCHMTDAQTPTPASDPGPERGAS